MYGDQTGGLPDIVVNMSTLEGSIRPSYSVIIDTQFYTDTRKGVEVIQTLQLSNGDTSGLLIPVQVEGTMTELPHVAVQLTPTTYNKYIELIAHNVSDFGKIYNINDLSIEILDNLTLLYDRQVYNGTFGSGGELVNYGLLNNPNTVNITTPVNIETIDDLSSTVEDLKNQVINATSCADNEVSFIFSGSQTRAFLKKYSGNVFETNGNIIARSYPENAMLVLPINIVNQELITAFCNKKVKGHSTGLPSLFNQGKSQGDKYYSFYHFSKGSYGTEMKKQGVAYSQPLSYNVTLLKSVTEEEVKAESKVASKEEVKVEAKEHTMFNPANAKAKK